MHNKTISQYINIISVYIEENILPKNLQEIHVSIINVQFPNVTTMFNDQPSLRVPETF